MDNIKHIYRQLDNAIVLIADISSSTRTLNGDEMAAVRDAIPKRKKEFAAGRDIALTALNRMGFSERSLPASSARYPIWPSGAVGSISHTSRVVGAAVTAQSNYSAIGFDIENIQAVDPDLYPVILRDSEQQDVSRSPTVDLATIIFGCKEAVYKAVNPTTSEFIDFLDVRINVSHNTFSVECVTDKRSATMINSGKGFYELTDELVTSLFLVE